MMARRCILLRVVVTTGRNSLESAIVDGNGGRRNLIRNVRLVASVPLEFRLQENDPTTRSKRDEQADHFHHGIAFESQFRGSSDELRSTT
jgi:hypothetical protein